LAPALRETCDIVKSAPILLSQQALTHRDQPDFCGAQSIEYRLLVNLVSNFCRQAVNLTPPGGSMATSTHLAELEQRHRILEDELSEALLHPSVDDFTLAELKRRKLQLKDEMARLAHMECDSVH
jgi:hypothetical protein